MLGIITTIKAPMYESHSIGNLVSEALFGELCSVVGNHEGWSHIKLEYDGQSGWVDSKMVSVVEGDACDKLLMAKCITISKFTELQPSNSPFPLKLLPGSEVRLNNALANQMEVGKTTYSFKQRVSTPAHGNQRNAILATALEYIHSPEFHGGRTPLGIDSSGFTQMVCKLNGITLPRGVAHQMSAGRILTGYEQSLPGDLAFFTSGDGRVNHVGFVHENQRVIHTWGEVRIDSFDGEGIYNQLVGEYTHKLVYVKNIID